MICANHVVDLGAAAAILAAGTAEDQLRAFAWTAEHLGVARSVLAGIEASASSAVRAATDRLLPRLLGVHLTDPPADLAFGQPAYWSDRRLRVVSTTDAPAVPRMPLATEVTADALADPTGDLVETVRRWRA